MLYKDSNTVGYGEFTSGKKVSTFTEFTLTIDYFMDETPDSASIWISTARDRFKEHTELTIDALSFTGPAPTGLFDNAPANRSKLLCIRTLHQAIQ
jgi:hypothetical protein